MHFFKYILYTCTSYGSSTTNRTLRSPSRSEWLRRRQSRPSGIMQYVDPPSPGTLRQTPHRTPPSLLRIIGAQRKRPDHRMTSYNRALEITGCESIETTLRTRRLLWAGTLLRMSGGRLPKRIVVGKLEGAVRRGRVGRRKNGQIASRATSGRLA